MKHVANDRQILDILGGLTMIGLVIIFVLLSLSGCANDEKRQKIDTSLLDPDDIYTEALEVVDPQSALVGKWRTNCLPYMGDSYIIFDLAFTETSTFHMQTYVFTDEFCDDFGYSDVAYGVYIVQDYFVGDGSYTYYTYHQWSDDTVYYDIVEVDVSAKICYTTLEFPAFEEVRDGLAVYDTVGFYQVDPNSFAM